MNLTLQSWPRHLHPGMHRGRRMTSCRHLRCSSRWTTLSIFPPCYGHSSSCAVLLLPGSIGISLKFGRDQLHPNTYTGRVVDLCNLINLTTGELRVRHRDTVHAMQTTRTTASSLNLGS